MVSISNLENIDTIKEYYLKNKTELLKVLKPLDDTIGDHFSQEPVERRIDKAAEQQSIWGFNYVLRGGFKSTQSD